MQRNLQLPSNIVIPDTLKCAVVLEAVQGRSPCGVALRAILDRFCARRRRHSAVGARESLRRGRTREMLKKTSTNDRACANERGCPARKCFAQEIRDGTKRATSAAGQVDAGVLQGRDQRNGAARAASDQTDQGAHL